MATKIMYLADRYDGPQAGSERQLLQLVKHIDRSRYEPHMTLLRGGDGIHWKAFPCPVRVLDITELASLRNIMRVLRFALSLRRERFRIVHCYFNDTSMIAPPFLKLFGIRVLVSRRDMGFWYTPAKLVVLRIVAPFVDCYVANSQAVRRLVQRQEWVTSRKLQVIYNGSAVRGEGTGNEQTDAGHLDFPEHDPVVGIVANLKPIKRIDTLVEAFAITCAQIRDARLVVSGDTMSDGSGKTLETLKAMANRLGITDRVLFTGRIANPNPYIKRFTVAVLCSESEGFSNSIIEYMQARCPVVCTETGGNPELVKDGYNGFLVPIGDSTALADRIVRLLSDRDLARQISEAGYQTVSSTYTHERMVSEQMACYDRVLLGRR